MISTEGLVWMSDGTKKSISLVIVGDIILNKMYLPVTVTRIHNYPAHLAVGVTLDNGTSKFYTYTECKFFCHITNENNSHVSGFDTIANIVATNGKLKSDSKIFSPQSDVTITNYDNSDTGLTKTLYCLHTNDQSQSFIMNGIIVGIDPA